MNDILSLLTLFGDRYINCDDDQALTDVRYNRENMVEAFNTVVNCISRILTEIDNDIEQAVDVLKHENDSKMVVTLLEVHCND